MNDSTSNSLLNSQSRLFSRKRTSIEASEIASVHLYGPKKLEVI